MADTEDAGLLTCPALAAHLRDHLATWARVHTGSSTRVSRAAVLSAPPSIGEGEITAKGNLNARKVLTLRKDLLDRLYSDGDPAVITL
jgi:feruloyl-CoA synthase